ncbi:DUF2207 domain-containing protein [Lactobacillus sp. ESL0233]|nr:DUF2207 domain-containing protein [Lactobacillus sp. ESL0233]
MYNLKTIIFEDYIMKIKFMKVMPYLTILLLLFLYVKNVSAEVDYRIENNVTTASIKKDGSIAIKKQITYKFKSQSKGVFYQQNLAPSQNLVDAKVKIQNENQTGRYSHDFSLQKVNSGYHFAVYNHVKPNSRYTVTYFYKITQAITNYRDIAELNFMIIGNNWDKDLDHVKAVVLFPGPVKNIKAWAHGPLNGYIKVDPSKGRITLTANNLDGYSGIEVHTIFPLSVTPRNKNIVNQIHGPFVLNQEAKLAQEANCKRKKIFIFEIGLVLIIVLSATSAIVLGFTVKKQGGTVHDTNFIPHSYECPSVNAVVAQIMDKVDAPNIRAFIAYLMELAAKKKITIEDYQKDKTTFYRITLKDMHLVSRNPLLATLFNDVGNGQTVTTEEIKNSRGKKVS